jgi:SAM-dependent methyltransferase
MIGRRREDSFYQSNGYVMGSESSELRRLRTISVLYLDITRRWLEHTGIGPGMSVVDVGCGPGDVTLLAADLVGPSGSVVWVDGAPEALALARSRADRVSFERSGTSPCSSRARSTAGLPGAGIGALDRGDASLRTTSP